MNRKRWIEKEVVTAVHDNDLLNFLDSIGLLQKIEKNEVYCAKCGELVNLDNLGVVNPINNTIHLLCDNPLCLSKIDIEQETNE